MNENNQEMELTPLTTDAVVIPVAMPASSVVTAKIAKKIVRSNTPTDDVNLAALCMRVANKWAAYPQLTLVFIAQADFLQQATNFNTLIQQRVLEQQTRPTTTRTTKQLEADVKLAMRVVRGYLLEKYKEDAKVKLYLPDFGLEKRGNTWLLPTDQQRVLIAIRTAKAGTLTHGFGTKSFGTTFWTAMETNYTNAIQAAISNDGSASSTVAQKEVMKKEIKKTLVALRNAIRANYPDTYAGVLRDFGFQKEKA
jgi:hypothetical protein